METKYSIKELEQLSGIKAHTIRAWESRYNLITPQRTDTNIRYYTEEHLKKILNIAVLVRSGMRIKAISEMTEDQIRLSVMDAGRYQGSYDSQINGLKVSMLEFDEDLFESIYSKSLIQFGVEDTFSHIIGPFIQQVGTLWQAGAIQVGHEHFIATLVKQKLFALIDRTMIPPASPEQRSFLLYLPAEELHELGLLYIYYHLKKLGHRVIYLGQSVPLASLKDVSDQTKIDRFVSVFTSHPHFEELEYYFQRIENLFEAEDYRFFVTGLQFSKDKSMDNKPPHVKILPDLESLKKLF